MKYLWLTDIHLNFLGMNDRELFYQSLAENPGEAVLISGDIAEAPSLSEILKEMAGSVRKPIYFVLGNHDYYKGRVSHVREEMCRLTEEENLLFWLPASGPQKIGSDTILLGQDCWADGRYGKYTNSPIRLNDSRMIDELFEAERLGKSSLLEKMQEFADKDAIQLKSDLESALTNHSPEKIIVLVHVPPFRESCLYEGHVTYDDFLPFFGSKVTGDVLAEIAESNPDVEMLVLCGHTHSESYLKPLKNLVVKVGKSEYSRPEIQELISL